jgi:hypothetical protein
MKQFLIKVIFFLLPVMAVLCVLEVSLRNIPNNYTYKKEQLLKESENIQILVLGSSHAYYGIDPDYFSMNAFNCANYIQTLDLDYEILKKYGDKLDQLEYIIIPASYGLLQGSISVAVENWRIKYYILYYDIFLRNYPIKISNYFELLHGTMISNIKKVYDYYRKGSNLITSSEKGFALETKSNKQKDMEETAQIAVQRYTRDYSLFEYNKNIMERIVEWCGDRNVKLVLVTLPAYKTYREKLDKNQLNFTIGYMQDIARLQGVYYYNLLDDERFIKDFFYDADHLNDLGAMELTEILDNIIETINKEAF